MPTTNPSLALVYRIAARSTLLAAVSTALGTTPNPDDPWPTAPMLPPEVPWFPENWDPFNPEELPTFGGEIIAFQSVGSGVSSR
ncbi:MAG: hypothetical protein QGI75_07865 [Phycisphaerales bacterium]|nr:hypothetical protein [Phycisphaerales bacterium]MDP6890461.1 hypothetical protein [Phycisphaerales bacterium]